MNSDMSDGFRVGSGVDPANLKLILSLIGSGVILLVFAALVLQLFNSYSDGKLTSSEAIWGGIKLLALLGVIFVAVF